MTYMVTGATGNFGSTAINVLKELVPLNEIFALARTEEKASQLKAEGVSVRLGNYDDLDSLKKAFTGIDYLLFVSGDVGNRQVEHQNVIDAAKIAGIKYIAYTSLANADQSASFLAADHLYTERAIEASGIAHTFLRNNWYLENELPLINAALNGEKFAYSAGNGKIGWALRREYAEAGAKVLAARTYPEILELSGTPITYEVLAKTLKEVTGKSIVAEKVNAKAFIANLVASGLPEEVAQLFQRFQEDSKQGVLDVTSDVFEQVLGHPLVSLREGLEELLNK